MTRTRSHWIYNPQFRISNGETERVYRRPLALLFNFALVIFVFSIFATCTLVVTFPIWGVITIAVGR